MFVGRDETLQRMFAIAEQARRQQPGHLHVVGPAGIGKSRLLGECAVRLRHGPW